MLNLFVFRNFTECEEREMARLETRNARIPVNVVAEKDTDFDLHDGEECFVVLFGIGNIVDIYPSKEALYSDNYTMDIPSVIPVGTFPIEDTEEPFEESPHILFVGKVVRVDFDSEAEDNQPNYCLTVETLEMTILLYLLHDGPIEVGSILRGIAWLFGSIYRA